MMKQSMITLGAVSTEERMVMIEAARHVMQTQVGNARGGTIMLGDLTDQLGTSENVDKAVRSVAKELLKRRLTFSEAINMPKSMLPRSLQNAFDHFYFLMHDDRDLASVGKGRGQMLLMQMNPVLERYYAEHVPTRLVS